MNIFCAQHSCCSNTECLRKPTAKDLDEIHSVDMQRYPRWVDYHLPFTPHGMSCPNYKDAKK